jgi:dimethylamine/trimethylamine dehydrogenase
VVLYDDDHYYMGGVLAELLVSQGCQVTLVTPAPLVSYWSQYTLEQERIQRKLMHLGVRIVPQHLLRSIGAKDVRLSSTIVEQGMDCESDAVVLVTDRIPNNNLYYELRPALGTGQLRSLRLVGDAEAPNIIAQAVFSGHLAAREFEETQLQGVPFRVERASLQ